MPLKRKDDVPKRRKTVWGGFSSGHIDIREVDDGWGGFGTERRRVPALFTNRKDARRQYQDVRRVCLTWDDRG